MVESNFANITFQKCGFSRPHRWNFKILTADSESPWNLSPDDIWIIIYRVTFSQLYSRVRTPKQLYQGLLYRLDMKIPSLDPESTHPIGLLFIYGSCHSEDVTWPPPSAPNWFACSMDYRSAMMISCPDSESPQITSLDTWPLLGGVISCQGKGDGLSISAGTRPPKRVRKFIYTLWYILYTFHMMYMQ